MTVIARGLSVVFDETIGLFTRLAADPHCVAICHPFMLPPRPSHELNGLACG